MRIITDSAADFTNEELIQYNIRCVRTKVLFADTAYTPGIDMTNEEFWQRMFAGENAKTSQPSPEEFLEEFNQAKADSEEAVYIGISSALSGTYQSANIACEMAACNKLHLVDSLNGAAGQKLLTLYACKLRDEGILTAREIAERLMDLKKRIRLFASVDTLEYLGRSGRISKAVASLGNIAQLKPLLEVSREGKIVMCGKGIGRKRAIENLAKKIASVKIDSCYPMIPLFSHTKENCLALIEKLHTHKISVNESMLSAIGTAIAPHIGPGAYGVAFVEAQS
ncbi:MAG: DegV family protein [Clostridia bacterium]|nr:DegV family protein [Clostridia bacterium]